MVNFGFVIPLDNMHVKYDKGSLVIDLHDFLSHVDKETKMDMVESLACDDDIIKHVADQILERWTENCFSGGSTYGGDAWTPLDKAWREVAKRSGEVAKREIEKLERVLRGKDEEICKLREELVCFHSKLRF